MIHVKKPPYPDPEWLQAVADGDKRAKSHMKAFLEDKPFSIDGDLYKRFMRYLKELFHEKCAYCEVVIGTNQPGDVEHYRPKGRVVGDDLKPVEVVYGDRTVQHPGYFWLAYDWDNLLPSCADCNRYRHHDLPDDTRVGAGKADRFPVESFRAKLPEEVGQERPLLVNPSVEDPYQHFEFQEDGLIRAKTAAGERTLRELGLNVREKMVDARRNAFEDAANLLTMYLLNVASDNQAKVDAIRDRINRAWSGAEAHTVMQRAAFEAMRKKLQQRNIHVQIPFEPTP